MPKTYKVTVVKRETYVLEVSSWSAENAQRIAMDSVEGGNITPKMLEQGVIVWMPA
jgi:hypothetical protein